MNLFQGNIFRNLLLLSVLFSSCGEDISNSEPLFTSLPSSATQLSFSNSLPIELDLNIFNYMYYYNGSGLAVGDLNNDGWTDIIFGSNLQSEKIYLNKGGLTFEDISSEVNVDGGPKSWTNGIALADVNGDGMLDIYLAQVGTHRSLDCRNKLFICTGIDEKGLPSYKERAKKYGLDFKGFSTQAGFFDYDRDGDLDMFLMNHSLHNNGTFGQRKEFAKTYDPISGDRLYRNDGETFTDVTKESGIESSVIGYGLGLAFGDFNNDGFADIYIGNDFHENDYLYINQQDGTFKDSLTAKIKHTSRFSMGVDIADINQDGFDDIISLDMLPEDPKILKASEGEDALDIFNFKLGYGYNHQYARNALQINQNGNYFKEIAAYANVHATDWSWSPLLFDFDMDGKKDLFITNGIPKRMNDIDYINFISGNDIQYKIQFDQLEEKDLSALDKIPEIKLNNKFFLQGEDLQFEDLNNQIKNISPSYSNSAAFADFDNDGDYDLVVNNINDEAMFYRNNSKASSLKIALNGVAQNTSNLGTLIQAYYDDKIVTHSTHATRGFQSSMINQVLIPKKDLTKLLIVWPTGETQNIEYEGQDSLEVFFSPNQMFTKANRSNKINAQQLVPELQHKHKENPFVEFNREPLIPFSTSSDGPALAVGDVNNDGLEDFFIGSSKRKRNALYIQKQNGSFDKTSLIGVETDSIYEEVDAQFVDIDNDNDLDLVVATGGNEYKLNSTYTQPLLYLNNNGILTKSTEAFEGIHITASCLAFHDIDNDGDLDLFIGARAEPRKYGVVPQSVLLENNGEGIFKNVSDQWLEDATLGFIRDAKWADIDGDKKEELILAKEWAPIEVLQLGDKSLEAKNINNLSGWWNHLDLIDIDNDGDLDLFAGNLGTNSRLKATEKEKVKMYFNDFDGNGTSEQILSYYVKGRELPFSNLMELQKQIPSLKKKYIYAKDFSEASIHQLFGKDKIKNAVVFEADHLENTLFINDGSGNFSIKELPYETQWTSYYSSAIEDLNQDGKPDIILGGNYHYCNVQMGRYDADNGSILLSNAAGGFDFVNIGGALIQGEVRNIRPIEINSSRAFIYAQNNDRLKILQFE